jgi:predicted DNA-binding protein (MmcQ/YjbR family)
MSRRAQKAADIARAEEAIASAAASHPEVVEEGPWGHRAFKVRRKTFLFLVADAEGLSFSVKLPSSAKAALRLGFTAPTEYGLGKAGWVTARFAPDDPIPLATVREWLDESFRAIAPKKLGAGLAASSDAKPTAKRGPSDAKPTAKRGPSDAKPTAKRRAKKA